MTKTIGIIDYKAGNAPSVWNAMRRLGVDAALVAAPEEARSVSALILPGVGSALATMRSLAENGWLEALNDMVIKNALPFLGICVGMQILFEHSEEEDVGCLGWMRGRVVRFSAKQGRVPQMGWNSATFKRDHPILRGTAKTEYFYFVNSYYVKPADESVILGATDYGGEFCSALAHENIVATQFHLEKSGEAGLRMLRNFAEWSI